VNVSKGLYVAGWVATCVGGVATLFAPPMTIGVPLGPTLTAAWAWLWIVGGLLAAVAAVQGWWATERLAVGMIAVGLVVYFGVIVILHFGGTGSRVSQMTMLALAGVALANRVVSIWGHDYEPRGG